MENTKTPHGYWTEENDCLSKQEGWILTNDVKGRSTIAMLDDPESCDGVGYTEPKFKDDLEAQKFVCRLALEGSKVHLLAVYLEGFNVSEELDISPPKFLLEG